jgi:phosphatidylglycerophosphate synthase
MPEQGQSSDRGALSRDAAYPQLAKKASDGMYCYVVQRRISPYVSTFCVRRGISANAATGIDFLMAILAAWSLSQGYYIAGVVLIQLFGIWSCVDGEVARLANSGSKLGDFYDTMTDRSAEFLIFGGVLISMPETNTGLEWGTLFFGYMGMVFLITASSEKYRSVYHRNYEKSEHERVFSWLCAGSDTRFLYLSLAIIFYLVSGQTQIIEWLVITLTILLAINFVFRMWKISRLSDAAGEA